MRGVELGTVHQTISAESRRRPTTARLLDADAGDRVAAVARRVTSDTDGAPVLYSEHRYPADRTTFEIEFSLNVGVLQHV